MTLHIRIPGVQSKRVQRTVRYWWTGLILLLGLAACTASATANPPTGGIEKADPPGPVSIPGGPAPTEPAPPTGTPDGSPFESSSAISAGGLPDDPTELMRAAIDGNIAVIAQKMVASGSQSEH